MFHHIEKIRRRPEVEKRNITLGITITLFLGIVFVWLSLLNISGVLNEDVSQQRAEAPTPFANVTESVASIFDDAKKDVNLLKTKFDDGIAR